MNEEELLEKAREKYPIGIDEICLYSSFEQILGKKPKTYTEDERKRRWERAKSFFNKELLDCWTSTSSCCGCKHLNKNEAWCNLMGLPCTINPDFSFGMVDFSVNACDTYGFEHEWPDLFEKEFEVL